MTLSSAVDRQKSRDLYALLPPRPGIYAIKNRVSGRVYVGSSVNIYNRIRGHIRRLFRGDHNNKLLVQAWEKHGPSAFLVEVLEECEVEVLIEKEQEWMDRLGSYMGNGGYNILPNAGTVKGAVGLTRITEKHREALLDGLRSYWDNLDPEIRSERSIQLAQGRAKKFIVTHPDGNEEEVFNLKSFADKYNLSYNALKKTARFSQREHMGFHVRTPDLTREEANQLCHENQKKINKEKWEAELKKQGLERKVWKVYKDDVLIATLPDGHAVAKLLKSTYGAIKTMRRRGAVVTRGPLRGYRIGG